MKHHFYSFGGKGKGGKRIFGNGATEFKKYFDIRMIEKDVARRLKLTMCIIISFQKITKETYNAFIKK